jgi:hypothetical protein
VNGAPRNATISFDFLDKGKNTWLRFMLMQEAHYKKPQTIQFEK